MHEDLLGYLLGALEVEEQERIERALAADAELRRELQRLRRNLEPLESVRDEQAPPPGLADRVCTFIAREDVHQRPVPRAVADQHFAVEQPGQGDHSRGLTAARWSPADLFVMALVALVAFTLFLPALAASRYHARKAACANNLRVLGMQLTSFSDLDVGRQFPFVPLVGNRGFAGVFAPALLDSQLLTRSCRWLVCPGSELAENTEEWFVPSLAEIDEARGSMLTRLQWQAGGSYAYSIGYIDEQGYRGNRNMGRSFYALVADAPSRHLPGRVSAHHGGRGQNIGFEDGHVEFVTNPQLMGRDDPLRNLLGYVGIGVHRNDAVLMNSQMTPQCERLLAPVPWTADAGRIELP